MDYVKKEESNIIDEESYKIYMESLQKSHQIETMEYQHTPISMEQLHQAVQSSLNNSMSNFQLPISPRQMSTLMLKTNHLTRSLNFNELPTHLPKNLTMEMELIPIPELQQNNEMDLQNGLHEHDLRNMAEINSNLRVNDVHINRDLTQELQNEIELSHLTRQNLEDDILSQEEVRRSLAVQTAVDNHILEQHLAQRLDQNIALRLDQNERLDQSIAQRLDQVLAQRLDQQLAQRLDQRIFNSGLLHEQKLDQNEHLYPMPYIKAEQEDDGYFYDNINQGLNNTGINGEIPHQPDHTQPNSVHHEQIYAVYNNHMPIPPLNPIDLYSRPNYVQNYISEDIRENAQNLVIHRQFDNNEEIKKLREDERKEKSEEPKENLKPTDHNKMFYEYTNDYVIAEKNENDSGLQNKINEDLAMSIKGEYTCYKCNDVFPSKRVLKSHAKSCDSGDSTELEKLGKFSCSQCAYRCQSPAILKIHERTHSGEKPYACTFCDYKSGQKNNVAKHILLHMKQKPFACRYCEYRCAQKNNLVVHERTHTGYKPFACPFCEYRTVQKPNLVKHMYLHTDQKPFSCDMCNYRCVQKTNLTKHKQRHLNEKSDKLDVKNQLKPYKPRQKSVKCPECPYRCVQKSSLEKHLQFKHTQSDENGDNGLSLMKDDSEIQNLSVKKSDQFVCESENEPLQM